MIDSITTLYTNMQRSTQQMDVSTAVLARSIETVQQAGENVGNLLHDAAAGTGAGAGGAITDPMLGRQINIHA